mgnify:CR=1 FL=1
MKRLLTLVLLGCLLCMSVGYGEDVPDWFAEVNAQSPSYLLHFMESWPEELLPVVQGSGYEDAAVLDGYAVMRWGTWSNGQVLLQQAGVTILGAFTFTSAGSWDVVFNDKAIDETLGLPTLLPEAAEYTYTDYQVSQYDGSRSFKLVYSDGTEYRWFRSTDGWRLSSIMRPGKEEITFSRSEVMETENRATCFLVQDVTLAGIDVAALPKAFADFLAISDQLPEANGGVGQLHAPDDSTMDADESTPDMTLLDAPNAAANVTAYLFNDVRVQVMEEQNGYLQIMLSGGLTGWVREDYVVRGSARAAYAMAEDGHRAKAYLTNGASFRLVYADQKKEKVLRKLQAGELVFIQAILGNTSRNAQVLVACEDGETGWMRLRDLSQTDNMTYALVESDDLTKRLNLRASPSTEAASLGKYYAGTRVTFLFTTIHAAGWAYVGIEDQFGWVKTEYLNYSSDANGGYMAPPLVSVKRKEAALYIDNTSSQRIVSTYAKGTKVEVLGVDQKLAHVRMQDGTSGYMKLKDIGGEPKASKPNRRKLKTEVPYYTEDGTQMGVFPAGTELAFAERSAAPLVYAYSDAGIGWVDSALAWK